MRYYQSPCIKFLNHTAMYTAFLALLALATFGVKGELDGDGTNSWENTANVIYHYEFRVAASNHFTIVELVIVLWIVGMFYLFSPPRPIFSKALKIIARKNCRRSNQKGHIYSWHEHRKTIHFWKGLGTN